MINLNNFGKSNFSIYLEHYANGLISFKDVISFIGTCFNDRGLCPIKKKAYDIGFSDGCECDYQPGKVYGNSRKLYIYGYNKAVNKSAELHGV